MGFSSSAFVANSSAIPKSCGTRRQQLDQTWLTACGRRGDLKPPSREISSSGRTHVHFPATSGQVEEERHFQLPEGLEVLAEAFAGELFQSVLVPLGRLLHLPFLSHSNNANKHHRGGEGGGTFTSTGTKLKGPKHILDMNRRHRWVKDLVKAVPLLHQFAEQDDHDVGFGGGHGPSGRTCINTGGKGDEERGRRERKGKKKTPESRRKKRATHTTAETGMSTTVGMRDGGERRAEKGSSAEKVPSSVFTGGGNLRWASRETTASSTPSHY